VAAVPLVAVGTCHTVGVPVIVIPHTFVLSAAVPVVDNFQSKLVCRLFTCEISTLSPFPPVYISISVADIAFHTLIYVS